MATTASSDATARVARGAAASPAQARRVPFADLVRIHHRWRHAMRAGSGASDAERARLDEEYHAALHRFEAEHGEIVSSYWCAHVESAVALTRGPRRRLVGRVLRPAPRFHRVSDWATKDDPEIARALHKCDELAIRCAEMLRGRARRVCMQLVMTSACHLLSLVDARDSQARTDADRRSALAAEQRELANVASDYRHAANGDAQLVYFGGMAIGVAALFVLYSVAGHILASFGEEAAPIVGCLVAGATGAMVSVIQRVNAGTFALDADIDRGYTLFLGMLRPWIGSVFGLLTYFAVTSGFVEIFKLPQDETYRFYFLCVIAFAAGFSERWAQDTLTGGLTGRGRKPAGPAPAMVPDKAPAAAARTRSTMLDDGGDVSPAAHE